MYFDESISAIVSSCNQNDNELIYEFGGEQQDRFNKYFKTPVTLRFALHFSIILVKNVVEKVKNTILEWTIKLESEGILGEGMKFNSTEIETAKQIPQTNNYYLGNTNVINGSVNNSSVIAGNENHVEFTYEKAKEAVDEIETVLNTDKLSTEDKETAIEMLEDIKEKISEKKKPNIIKYALGGLKDFLIGVGASATVAAVQSWMGNLF